MTCPSDSNFSNVFPLQIFTTSGCVEPQKHLPASIISISSCVGNGSLAAVLWT